MGALSNTKHEKFCLKWHETNNKTEAYRFSHPHSSRWKDATINNKASALSKESEILARLKELQDKSAARHFVTIDSLLDELQEARLIALQAETPQSSAAVSATMAKAKLMGLDISKIDHTSSDGSMTPKGIDITVTPEEAARIYTEMMEGK